MKKLLFILMLHVFAFAKMYGQSFSVEELVTLANAPVKNIDNYLYKKGFVLSWNTADSNDIHACFIEKRAKGNKVFSKNRSINILIKNETRELVFHTTILKEYTDGLQRLLKSGFFYDKEKDITKDTSILFLKGNIAVRSLLEMEDSVPHYSFTLKEKAIPTSLTYAEDLLRFDSHEFLVSFFGKQNVKTDMYYFSEKELKKCSVLFSGTPRQVVFVWGDDIYLNKLQYILVSNVLPTEGGKDSNPLSQNNEWQLKNGIYPGMALKELLKINEMDFDIYGNKSELAFLVKPNTYGKIDFKKTAIMLSCRECFDNKIFNRPVVSALEVAKANLPMRVFDVVIYAANN